MRPLPPTSKAALVALVLIAVVFIVVTSMPVEGLASFLPVLGIGLAIMAVALFLVRKSPGYEQMRLAEKAMDRANAAAPDAERTILAEHIHTGATVRRRFLAKPSISGTHAGLAYEHYMIPGGKNVPPRPAIAVPTSAPGEFHVHPESGMTKAVKAMGMVDEFRSGDAALDGEFFFSGSTDEYVRELFGARENMAVLRALFAHGFDQVEKTPERLIVSKPQGSYLGVGQVREAVALLARLRLPPTVAGAEGKRLVGRTGLYIVRGVAAAIVLIGIAAWFVARPMVGGWGDFVAATLPLVAILTTAGIAAAYFVLRGRSMSARGLVEIVLFLPLIIAGLFGTLALANRLLDSGSAEEHQVRLVRAWDTRGSKGGVFFHLEFDGWRGGGTVQIRYVHRDTYALARVGQIWKLRVRPGWLERPWVEALAPIAP